VVDVKLANVGGVLALIGVSAGAGEVSALAFFREVGDGSGLDRFFGDGACAGLKDDAAVVVLMGAGADGVGAVMATAVDFEESRRMATI
jgi:hypothetical protein